MPGSTFLHSIAASLAGVAAVLLAGAITDGRSLVEADADGVYGIGLYHDSNGRRWDEEKHAAHNCSDLKGVGQGALASSLTALVMTGFSVLVHAFGASAENGQRCLAVTTLFFNVLAVLAFATASALSLMFYHQGVCNVQVRDKFGLNYGPFVLIADTLVMIVCAVLSVFAACTRPVEAAAPPAAAHKQEMPHSLYPARPAYPAYPNGEPYP